MIKFSISPYDWSILTKTSWKTWRKIFVFYNRPQILSKYNKINKIIFILLDPNHKRNNSITIFSIWFITLVKKFKKNSNFIFVDSKSSPTNSDNFQFKLLGSHVSRSLCTVFSCIFYYINRIFHWMANLINKCTFNDSSLLIKRKWLFIWFTFRILFKLNTKLKFAID